MNNISRRILQLQNALFSSTSTSSSTSSSMSTTWTWVIRQRLSLWLVSSKVLEQTQNGPWRAFKKTTNFVNWRLTNQKQSSRYNKFNINTTSHSHNNILRLGLGLFGFIPLTVSAAFWPSSKSSKEDQDSGSGSTVKNIKRNKKSTVAEIKLINKKDKNLLEDILEADKFYENEAGEAGEIWRYVEIYNLLIKHREKDEPEMLWRLARAFYDKSKRTEKSNEKKEFIEEGYKLIERALKHDDKNFAVHKWMAILLNEYAGLQGTKAQIQQLENVRYHMTKAIELNPHDPTSVYLLGHWCFSVANVPWYQQKLASAIFATPPTCEFSEALRLFLKAEAIDPGFYTTNLLFIAKSYLKIGDPINAERYLLSILTTPIDNQDERSAFEEATKLYESTKKKAEEARKNNTKDSVVQSNQG